MKICLRCEKTYPDSESFCETDGSALVSRGPAFAEQQGEGSQSGGGKVECPVCGGKAEPGEVICNFCGTRLIPEESPGPEPSRPEPAGPRPGTQIPPRSGRVSGPIPPSSGGNRALVIAGYLAAAALALIAGVYFALHLSSRKAPQVAVAPSPTALATPAEVPAGPVVALANVLPLQVLTTTGGPSPDRTPDMARGKFEDSKPVFLDAYRNLLSTNPAASDGMMVRIRVLPGGTVDRAAVRTSTSPNPELDAKVAKEMMGWKFTASSGPEVEIDYPIIFAPGGADRAGIESALQTRVASLSPSEAAEFAASAAPAVAAVPTPEAAPSEARRAPRVEPRPPRKKLAAVPKPTPSLLERVQEKLKSNPKLRRARAYTSGGTVTLSGRVFDDNDKLLAERVVKRIPGVTSVVNTLATDTAQWAAAQAKIKRQLENAGLPNVTVKVIGNDAYLSGTVKTKLERTRAVTIAQDAAAVTVRSNLIRVEVGSVFGF